MSLLLLTVLMWRPPTPLYEELLGMLVSLDRKLKEEHLEAAVSLFLCLFL